MKNGSCPKCNARQVHSNVEVRTRNRTYLALDMWTNPVPLHVYMCGNCGYLEYYVSHGEHRDKVARKWPLVN